MAQAGQKAVAPRRKDYSGGAGNQNPAAARSLRATKFTLPLLCEPQRVSINGLDGYRSYSGTASIMTLFSCLSELVASSGGRRDLPAPACYNAGKSRMGYQEGANAVLDSFAHAYWSTDVSAGSGGGTRWAWSPPES